MPKKFNVYVQGSAGPLNPAINSWEIDDAPGASTADIAAQLIGFTVKWLIFGGSASSIQRVTSGGLTGPQVDLPFPQAELAAINAAVDAPYVANYSAYGETVGGGGQTPVGCSVLMTEYTEVGGRRNGRKYLPWPNDGVIDPGSGLVDADTVGNVRAFYQYWIFGNKIPSNTPAPGIPVVLRPLIGTAQSPVTDVKVSSAPARLRSRIR